MWWFWFHNPIYIFICTLLIVGMFFWLRGKKKKQNFLGIDLLFEVYKKNTFLYYVFLYLLCAVSILFSIILARPYSSIGITEVKKQGIDIEIVFDVSTSMIAEDLRPSRISVAKAAAWNFVSGLESDRVGITLFSGKPFQSIPLSDDYDFIKEFITNISIETINQNNPLLQGTAIWDALVLWADILLANAPEREKVIILITDGEANRGLEPIIWLQFLKENNIKVYTIGVGKDEETFIRQQVASGITKKIAIWWVDEQLLKKISFETGGKYFRADSPQTFHKILETIGKLEKKEIRYEQVELKESKKHIFLLLLFIHFTLLSYIVWFKKLRF